MSSPILNTPVEFLSLKNDNSLSNISADQVDVSKEAPWYIVSPSTKLSTSPADKPFRLISPT